MMANTIALVKWQLFVYVSCFEEAVYWTACLAPPHTNETVPSCMNLPIFLETTRR